jgi:hypothetical protein
MALAAVVVSFLAVCATFFGVVYTNKTNQKLQDGKLRSDLLNSEVERIRAKGEELYSLIAAFDTAYRKWSSGLATPLIMGRSFTADEIPEFSEASAMLLRIELLCRVYYPETVSAFEALRDAVNEGAKTIVEIHNAKTPRGYQELSKKMILSSAYVSEKCHLLQRILIVELRKLHTTVLMG